MTTNWLIFFLEPLFVAATAIQAFVWLLLGDAGRPKVKATDQVQKTDITDNSALDSTFSIQHSALDSTFSIQHSALKIQHSALIKVSIIICARNEADNLRRHLPAVLTQQYAGTFEVLVVDDASTDNTSQTLAELAAVYPQLRVIRVADKTVPGKKGALEQGIAKARYDWLLLTDADCMPATPYWLAAMVCSVNHGVIRSNLNHGEHGVARSLNPVSIVLGYAPMRPEPGLWNKWARYETAWTAMQYLTLAGIGAPYMGVGRNLAWRKELFVQAGGFSAHAHIPSGDDDLLVGAVARPDNFAVCLQPEAFVFSDAKPNLSAWIRQKRRHLGASALYQRNPSLLLGGLATMHTLHYGLGAILLIAGASAPFIWALYAARMMTVWPAYARWLSVLQEKDLRWYVPLLDGLLAVYYGTFVPLTLFFRKQDSQW